MTTAVSYQQANSSRVRCCIFFAVLFLPALSFAQERGTVEVVKDPLIDTLIAKHYALSHAFLPSAIKINGALPVPATGTPGTGGSGSATGGTYTAYGYRVQFYFGSNRQAAYKAQEVFLNEHPEYRTYISYTEPNFKVQAGDFRSRIEAEKLRRDLRDKYPSLFIISGKINIKIDSPQ